MRKGLLRSLAVVLVGNSLAMAQSWGPPVQQPLAPPANPGMSPPLPLIWGPALSDLPDTPPANPPKSGKGSKAGTRANAAAGVVPVKGSTAPWSLPPTDPAAPHILPTPQGMMPMGADGPPVPYYYGPTLADIDPAPHTANKKHHVPKSVKDAEIAADYVPKSVTAVDHVDDPPERMYDRFWVNGEYLMWWFKNATAPPLVTSGGSGIIGANGTTVALDKLDFDDDFRNGARFGGGYHFKECPHLGIEGSYFFITDRTANKDFSSNGSPVLARPFLNAVTGSEDAGLIASPLTGSGRTEIAISTSLWGAETNLAIGDLGNEKAHFRWLVGFRYLDLSDDLRMSDQFTASASVPVFGGSHIEDTDLFRARNQFYGGQIGAECGFKWCRLTMDLRGQIALGTNSESVAIDGSTVINSPTGGTSSFVGGRFALPTNIGSHNREILTIVPQGMFNVGFAFTPWMRAYAGYTFLYIQDVSRAGNAIDRTINISQVPTAVGPGSLVGPARPAFSFHETDFWAQGVNFGLEFRY
jgi:hypothetical protein